MKDKVIFIDDQKDVRDLFGRRLRRLFKGIADVVPLEPLPTIRDMLDHLLSIQNVVSFIIDENLTYSGGTNYQGVGLIKKIREIDSKIPIYILTSDTSWVDPLLGEIEFVIDKIELNDPSNKSKFLQKFVRHLATYEDIKSDQAKRFDELLIKSLSQPLQQEEKEEYEALNAVRARAFIDESSISERDIELLKESSDKLDRLERRLKDLKGDG